MFRLKIFFLFLILAGLLQAGSAYAACAPPANPGLKVCFPNNNSSVYAPVKFELSGTPKSGSFSRLVEVDNGKVLSDYFYVETIFEYGLQNGFHHVTFTAYDTAGNTETTSVDLNVVGFAPARCSAPTAPGVNLCWPLPNTWQGQSFPFSATASGKTQITSLSVFFDGKFLQSARGNSISSSYGVFPPPAAGNHQLAVIAYDKSGAKYTAISNFKTFYSDVCDRYGTNCTPGIRLNHPSDTDVPSTFLIQADVTQPAAQIKSMVLYLDDKAVANSTGPGISHQLTLPSHTTHRLWINAWDINNKVYATYQTLYVQ